jgi:MinD superfamily P-loop ATPase
MVRLVELIHSFKIKTYAVVNKYDINSEITNEISQFLQTKHIKLLAKIPFNEKMVEAMTLEQTIIEYQPKSEIAEMLNVVWEKLRA